MKNQYTKKELKAWVMQVVQISDARKYQAVHFELWNYHTEHSECKGFDSTDPLRSRCNDDPSLQKNPDDYFAEGDWWSKSLNSCLNEDAVFNLKIYSEHDYKGDVDFWLPKKGVHNGDAKWCHDHTPTDELTNVELSDEWKNDDSSEE
jgi:hypothetical protein